MGGTYRGGRLQVLLGDKLLDFVDGHCLVDGAAGAGILTAAVAHSAAHRREGIFPFDQRQGVGVAALGGHFQVALHRNVGGAGRLAGSRAGVVAVDAVFVPVIDGPTFPGPT